MTQSMLRHFQKGYLESEHELEGGGVELAFTHLTISQWCWQCSGCNSADGAWADGACEKPPYIMKVGPSRYQIRPVGQVKPQYVIYIQWKHGLPETIWTPTGRENSFVSFPNIEAARDAVCGKLVTKERAERLAAIALEIAILELDLGLES